MAAHYIIFHLTNKVNVTASVLQNNVFINNKEIDIYVETPICEDPFVFCNPWLYSYNKINFLRKNYRADDNYLKNGSYLFFADMKSIKQNYLVIDTVFLVDDILNWLESSKKLPEKYLKIQGDKNSIIWERHFKFGIENRICNAVFQHSGEKTIEAQLYSEKVQEFSFLPYQNNEQIKLPFNSLPIEIRTKLVNLFDKRTKYPILLNETEKNDLLIELKKNCDLMVLKDIKQNKQ